MEKQIVAAGGGNGSTLTLDDVRDYLIDTNAVQDAENFLLSSQQDKNVAASSLSNAGIAASAGGGGGGGGGGGRLQDIAAGILPSPNRSRQGASSASAIISISSAAAFDSVQTTVRTRGKQGTQQQRDEVLNALINHKHTGRLGLLREEEEMRELQTLEAKLREESSALERERIAISVQGL